ncbi:rhomboid family intramembrane serine protease [Aquiluna sp.]|nr:rhomboid family intramembrane serine protease [Aquiluna sp.]MDA7799270.1 rhomboid family intramembrane serine protease [Aquiluna sp.]
MAKLKLARFQQAPVTSGLLALNVLIWLGQISPLGYMFTNSFFFAPLFAPWEPWRMLTAGFVHDWSGPLHILLNSYAIWIFGRILEPLLGPVRFLAMYLTSIVGGSVAVMWLSDPQVPVVGASGALFGLMGAYFIVVRSRGGNATQIFTLIAINFGLGLFVSGISWEGHLGGLVTGLAIAGIYSQTRAREKRLQQIFGVFLVWGVLYGLTMLKISTWM